MHYRNLPEMFFSIARTNPQKPAYRFKQDGTWQTITFSQASEQIKSIAVGLYKRGIRKGSTVALLSTNRPEWALCDYAIMCLGAVTVPLYPSLLPDQISFLLNHSEAALAIVEDEQQLDKIKTIQAQCSAINHFVIMDKPKNTLPENWELLSAVIENGQSIPEREPNIIDSHLKNVQPDDLATIIYTSGTTGEPKGAMLTHSNFLFNIESAAKIFTIYPDDSLLSFLPLSHVLERMAGHFLATSFGCTISYAESIEAVAQNLIEVKPTIAISVPRLFEKIYAKIWDMVESGPAVKRTLFNWAIAVGNAMVEHTQNKTKPGFGLITKHHVAQKLVFSKLQERLGGRMRFFVSGGAPLSAEIARFFTSVGIYILEGYGLTETSPAITMNHFGKFRFGSVGPVMPDEEVKIAEDGEILTRGGHVMKGYFKNPEETAEVFDEEGWFHTGDIGYLDNDGFLVITDRKKNIIVTAGGKNIAPQPIENKLLSSKYIEQAVVIGDKRKYCTAVLTLSEEALTHWFAENRLPQTEPTEYQNLEQLRTLIRSEIDRLTADLPSYETIKDFYIAPQLFTIESGHLTPSLKIKRREVEKTYFNEINQLYNRNKG